MGKYPEVDLDYKADLEIDRYHLELEWISQCQKMMTYSEAYAQAIYDRNRAKESMEVTRAEVDSVVRRTLAEQHSKVTEAMVSGAIDTDSAYRSAVENYHKADYVVAVLLGAVTAFNARKTALEMLVKLHGMDYYAEPYVAPSARAEINQAGVAQGKQAQTTQLKRVIKRTP